MRARLVVPVAVAVLAATLAVPDAAVAADPVPTVPADTADTADTADVAAGSGVRTVVLPTGDRVLLTPTISGVPAVTVLPADPSAHGNAYLTLRAAGHVYVIPQSLVAGANGVPDLNRFDVTALAGQATGSTPLAGDRKPAKPGALHTLKVRGFDRRGQRVEGGAVVAFNVDDSDLYIADQSFFRGEAAFSVPAGHYELVSFIATAHPGGGNDFTLATNPEALVTGPTTVVLDSRRAVPVVARTAEPTTQVFGSMTLGRTPAHGLSFTTSLIILGSTPMYATPTAPVRVGSMGFVPELRLGDSEGSTDHVVYDLVFPNKGAIAATQDHTITPEQVTTIRARYPSLVPGRLQVDARIPALSWQAGIDSLSGLFTAPTERIEYVSAHPDIRWLHQVSPDPQNGSGVMTDRWQILEPGQRLDTTWLGPAAHPAGQQETLPLAQECPACRKGDNLSVLLWPWGDNESGHWGAYDFPTGDGSSTTAFQVYENGALIADRDQAIGVVPLSADPAEYRLVLDAARRAPWWPTSTSTHTEWAYTSARRSTDQVPAEWGCGRKGGGGRAEADSAAAPAPPGGGGEPCSAEPLLFVEYDLPTDLTDTLPAGTTTSLTITVGHQLHAAATAVSSASVQVSFDDGATWTDAPTEAIAGEPGTYRAGFTTPQSGTGTGYISLRVRAEDAAGSRIDQSITRAAALPWAQVSASTGAPASAPPAAPQADGSDGAGPGVRRACAVPRVATDAACFALVRTDIPNATLGPQAEPPAGYGPADLRDAYKLPSTGGKGQTIAIIDAFDNPNAEADLAVYREHFGLPPCTTANGCFRKVNQRGAASPLPDADSGWGVEISLDLDMASAICPECRLLLVEADTPSVFDLATAVQTSVRLGATVVSNSYGSRGELSFERFLEPAYRYQHVAVVVSSGDYGYGNGAPLIGGPAYPGTSQYVTSVGGTSLTRADNARGWTESVWDGATSGCSAYIHKPQWQRDDLCRGRTVSDVSAVADPQTGLAVYDTFGVPGWIVVGGTSAAAPIIAGVYALAGNAAKVRYGSYPYQHRSALFDVTTGTNGTNCAGTYLCAGVPGYDAPTGLGTPNGTGAF